MNIRRGEPDDSPAIAGLIASFQPLLTVNHGGAGAEDYLASVSEAAVRAYLSSPRYCYRVLEQDSTLVGFIALRDETHLFHLFVAAAHQRQGCARALWHAALAELHPGGPPRAFTVNSSLNAVPVYTSFGFVAVGQPVQTHGVVFQPMRLEPPEDV